MKKLATLYISEIRSQMGKHIYEGDTFQIKPHNWPAEQWVSVDYETYSKIYEEFKNGPVTLALYLEKD